MLNAVALVAMYLCSAITPLSAQEIDPIPLNSSWTLSVGAQSVQVNDDGSFVIPNISAPDDFGPGGPGTSPDFLSDDWVRLTGFSVIDGITHYCWSQPFRLTQNVSVIITYDDLTFSLSPPPIPVSLLAVPDKRTLTIVNEEVQVRVFAFLQDGTEKDVTLGSEYTSYRTSNTAIAAVDGDGLVTAGDMGVAFITAINEGATTVAQLNLVVS